MGYMEEAIALRDECLRREDEIDKKARADGSIYIRDSHAQEHKEINKYFSDELKKLQKKYNITPK